MERQQPTLKPLIIINIALWLAACGGGGSGDDTNNDPSLKSGYFLDSAVQGLEYLTFKKSGGPPPNPVTYNSTRPAGLTNRNGRFKYKDGEFIKFNIGYIDITSFIPVKQIISPQDENSTSFPNRTRNIAAFLQSLDNDATLSNGIQITKSVRDRANTYTSFPGFNTSFDFPVNIQPIVAELTGLTDAGERDLLDISNASNHLNNTLNFANPGSSPFIYGFYSGTYTIDVRNCMDSSDNGIYNFSIELAIQNQVDVNFSGTATGTTTDFGAPLNETITFSGNISSSGEVSGNTTHTFLQTQGMGTFSGHLNGDTLTVTNPGVDTVGDTCTYTREIELSR